MPRAVSAEPRNTTGATTPMSAAEPPLTVKVPTAAKMLDLSETTVWKMIREGVFKPRRSGRNTLIPYAQLIAFVEGDGTLDGGHT